MKIRLLIAATLLAALPLGACQVAPRDYRGALAAPERVVKLAQLPLEQQLQDYYVDISYRVARQGEQLQVTGNFAFSINSQVYHRRVHDLRLLLFQLDEARRVMDSQLLARTSTTDLDRPLVFDRDVRLGPGVSAFALGYELIMIDEEEHVQIVKDVPRSLQK